MHLARRLCIAALLFVMGSFGDAVAQSSAQAQATARDAEAALSQAQKVLADWAQLGRYRDEDAQIAAQPQAQRVVFLGDSITDGWGRRPNTGEFFPGRPYVNRGISGQTTPQMLVRFEQDVVRLHPAVVVIQAGTNDVAGNTGPETPETIEDNYRAMCAIARSSGIRVVLASVLPAARFPWRPAVQPVGKIRELNAWLRRFAQESGAVYLDYYAALADAQGGMREGLSSDGVHPVAAGYALMTPLAEEAIRKALAGDASTHARR